MARITDTTPKKDGYRMPAEFEQQEKVFMVWPERTDTWREGARPAQEAVVNVANAIRQFEPVTVIASKGQLANARTQLPEEIEVVEASYDDIWIRDCGPTFVINDRGGMRGVDWIFNSWGGEFDGLYLQWDQDDALAEKVCEMEGIDRYRTDFVLEGGSIHVDGEGTVLTTEMCLLSEGRNPHLTKAQIEENLKEYLNAEKVIWIKDGIDPEETNGHIDDVACFVRPGEVACIYTDNEEDPFYEVAQAAYKTLCASTDAKGSPLKVHKVTTPKAPVLYEGAADLIQTGIPQPEDGDTCIASYINFLIVNGGVIVPQYGDENDELALAQLQEIFPDRQVVGVYTKEIVYGGGNIHCITQQMPKR